MDGKKTRLIKPSKQASTLRDHCHDFTFDYSYWSVDDNDENFTTQEQVFNDLGTDVVDCAFQGYNFCLFGKFFFTFFIFFLIILNYLMLNMSLFHPYNTAYGQVNINKLNLK